MTKCKFDPQKLDKLVHEFKDFQSKTLKLMSQFILDFYEVIEEMDCLNPKTKKTKGGHDAKI